MGARAVCGGVPSRFRPVVDVGRKQDLNDVRVGVFAVPYFRMLRAIPRRRACISLARKRRTILFGRLSSCCMVKLTYC